jgi:hypothetical protein
MVAAARSLRKLEGVPGIHLVDEGPHKVAGADAPRLGDRTGGLLARLPEPDLIVACIVDPEVAAARVHARNPHARSFDEDTVRRWARNHAAGAEAIASSRDNVILIDTSSGPSARDEHVARVLCEIQALA